ncbi:MAG: pyruvate kinase, partial [Candidatus Saccharimonadales bacterium]|nr:pyruvate kinase [Candidatus Saccharimonadales bacterium]
QIEWIRAASDELQKPVAIVQDLQGPKIRLGDFKGTIAIEKDREYVFEYGKEGYDGHTIPLQINLSKKMKPGEKMFIFDGRVHFTVTHVEENRVVTVANNDGHLIERKGINLPDTDFEGDIITDKDRTDISFGATKDIDFVAMSFIQKAEDVEQLRSILKEVGSTAKIIAKIETKAAVDNLEEIIKVADGAMVARGDLAIETAPEIVPIVQRQIIGKCIEHDKISIVATQMLASMTTQTEPTRAEVSDVATSVIVGADSVMLSDETANGEYPYEAVAMMKRIILYTQENSPVQPIFTKREDPSIQGSISKAVVELADQVGASAIVTETKSGATALAVAAHRPDIPIIMVTPDQRVAHQLALVHGGHTYVRPADFEAGENLSEWLREHEAFSQGDIVVITYGEVPGRIGSTDTIKVRRLD